RESRLLSGRREVPPSNRSEGYSLRSRAPSLAATSGHTNESSGTCLINSRNRRSAVITLEELFCNLFATRLVGYCYSFAFIEFFDTSRVLDESGALTRYSGMTDFDVYPPDLFRLQQQCELLKKDKWLEELSSL